MTPDNLPTAVAEMLERGAELTIFIGHGSTTMIVAAEHVLTRRALIYFVASDVITGNVHSLAFDEAIVHDAGNIEFIKRGAHTAYLNPVEENADARTFWANWQRWLEQNGATYREAIAVELRAISGEEA